MGDKKPIQDISNHEVVAEQLIEDIAKLKNDITFLRKLSAKDQKEIIKIYLNKVIDIPMMPEYIEAMLFGFLVNYGEHVINTRILSKEEDEG